MQDTFPVLQILDNSGRVLFPDAIAIKATVKPTAKIMEHPLESGASIMDHRVINLLEIDLSVILKPQTYVATYKQIENAFTNGQLLQVQTRVRTYSRMVIQSLPHDEVPDMMDTVAIAISLKEARIARPQYVVMPVNTVRDARDASTVNQGTVTPKRSVALDAIHAIGNFFGSHPTPPVPRT